MASLRSARLVLAVIVVLVAASVTAVPSRAEACDPDAGCLPAGNACSFDLLIQVTGGAEHRVYREFQDKDGNVVRMLQAGKGVDLTFTNLASGATLSTKANGSDLHTTNNPDGTRTEVATGHNVIILFPTDMPAGPSTTLYVGRVVYTVAPGEVFTIVSTSGRATDICAALSG